MSAERCRMHLRPDDSEADCNDPKNSQRSKGFASLCKTVLACFSAVPPPRDGTLRSHLHPPGGPPRPHARTAPSSPPLSSTSPTTCRIARPCDRRRPSHQCSPPDRDSCAYPSLAGRSQLGNNNSWRNAEGASVACRLPVGHRIQQYCCRGARASSEQESRPERAATR